MLSVNLHTVAAFQCFHQLLADSIDVPVNVLLRLQTLDRAEVIPAKCCDFWHFRGGLCCSCASLCRCFLMGSGHYLHASADIILVCEKLGDHSVQLGERESVLRRLSLADKVVICLTQQNSCIPRFGCKLMNVLHTLTDILGQPHPSSNPADRSMPP